MIVLRNFTKKDENTLIDNANNPKVAQYLREVFPSPYTQEDAEWWLQKGCVAKGTFTQAIDLEGKCVGSIGVVFQEAEHQFSAEIGYWLGERYWGKGIGTEAIQGFTETVFSKFDVKRIYAPVAGPNKSSMRILEKSGYVCEGVFKKNLWLRGALYDEHIFAAYG